MEFKKKKVQSIMAVVFYDPGQFMYQKGLMVPGGCSFLPFLDTNQHYWLQETSMAIILFHGLIICSCETLIKSYN